MSSFSLGAYPGSRARPHGSNSILTEIVIDMLNKHTPCLQQQLTDLPHCALSSPVAGDPIRLLLNHRTGIGYRDGQSCNLHRREINEIISGEGGISGIDAR